MSLLVSLLVFLVVTLVKELLFPPPQPEDAKPAGLGDFQAPTATEDRPVPLVWGTVLQRGPNIIWYGDLVPAPIKVKTSDGLFTSTKRTVVGYMYFMGIQFALCSGDDTDEVALLAVEIGKKDAWTGELTTGGSLSIDSPNFFGNDSGLKGTLVFYGGSISQGVDPYIATVQQEAGATPRYTRICHGVWEQDYPTKGWIGNSTSIQPWAFEVRRIPTGGGVMSSSNSELNVVGTKKDANPAHVLYELLTDTAWGWGQPSTDVDITNFDAVAATLFAEGNGFSMILDRQMKSSDLVQIIEEQIDGKLVLSQKTGLWKIKLARADYVVADLALLDESSVKEIKDISAGTWDDTINDVKVSFIDRLDSYKQTSAQAQDTGNFRMQTRTVPARLSAPGVKVPAVANNIAWRELRAQSRPLVRAVVHVDRTFWNLEPLDVIKWTNGVGDVTFTEKVFRVISVDVGSMKDESIKLTLVEDRFAFSTASFGDPFGTGWVPPDTTTGAVPTDQSVVIEAPRAFRVREPAPDSSLFGAIIGGLLGLENPASGGDGAKIWCGSRKQASEIAVEIRERNAAAPGPPTGSYSVAGGYNEFFLIGELQNAEVPKANTTTIEIDPNPDTQADILAAMQASATAYEMGVELTNLLMIGTGDDAEFVLCSGVVDGGGGLIDLTGCRRGVLDSSQRSHAAGTKVYVLTAGGLTDTVFDPSYAVQIKLLPQGITGQLDEASANTISLTMADRANTPYPPAEIDVNGTVWPTGTISLDDTWSGGSTEDEKGLELAYIRRDYRVFDEIDSIASEAALPGDFPTANNTEYAIEIIDDPDGAATSLFTSAWGVFQNDHDVSRTTILKFTDGVIPSRLRAVCKVRHTVGGDVLEAFNHAYHDFDTSSSALGSKFNLGALDTNDVSPVLTATDSGTYTFTIATDILTTGALEVQVEGGGWVEVIGSGDGLSGTLGGITAGDDIEVRHTQAGTDIETMLFVEDNGSTEIAYGVLWS